MAEFDSVAAMGGFGLFLDVHLGPTSRLPAKKLEALAKLVIGSANQLSYALAGSRSAQTPAAVSKWFPA